MGIYQNSAFLL